MASPPSLSSSRRCAGCSLTARSSGDLGTARTNGRESKPRGRPKSTTLASGCQAKSSHGPTMRCIALITHPSSSATRQAHRASRSEPQDRRRRSLSRAARAASVTESGAACRERPASGPTTVPGSPLQKVAPGGFHDLAGIDSGEHQRESELLRPVMPGDRRARHDNQRSRGERSANSRTRRGPRGHLSPGSG